jgi:1-acyl-sn-glycerol-3-phosphate acyltransferase
MPLWEWFYNNYFRVETDGWHHIPDRPVLFVGSHNGGLATPDLPMFIYDWVHRFGTQRPVYGLTHPKVWTAFPLLADVAARCGAIQAHPKIAMGAFQSGASVLVYPGGGQDAFRPHWQRQRIHFAGRRGFIKLALRERVPIVPLISWGAHDTLWVLEDCYDQAQRLHRHGMPWLMGIDPEVFPIYLGLPWGIGMGPLPNIPFPTQIHTRVCAPIYFERDGAEATKDKFYVEACAQRVITQMQAALNELATQVEGHQTGQPPLGNQIKPHV